MDSNANLDWHSQRILQGDSPKHMHKKQLSAPLHIHSDIVGWEVQAKLLKQTGQDSGEMGPENGGDPSDSQERVEDFS